MATGELSSSETARLEVRKTLLEEDYVDCIVQLSGQLFANTQIPCALWFLSKNRDGKKGFRKRKGETLFIDGRKLGTLIPGSRKQKQLSKDEIEQIASAYREFKRKGKPKEVAGFCRVAAFDEIKEHDYVLTPGRYVGAEDIEDDNEPFDDRFKRFTEDLMAQFDSSMKLTKKIRENLKELEK